MMINLNVGRQTFDFDCGPKALQIVFAYYGVEMREDELMTELKTDENGTPVQNMIALAEAKGFIVKAGKGFELEEIKRQVDEGSPVIVLLQAWSNMYMTLDDWKKDYDDGHYSIVIGHANGLVVFEDPASFRRTWLTEEEFLARWHDKDPRTGATYERFAMVLLGKAPVQPVPEHMD
ncbi:MAG: C39 family peptidase [Deltaproteobacteria bacterium]|nr:C39 family peptidase [Deltaproteobacteria bacterium]